MSADTSGCAPSSPSSGLLASSGDTGSDSVSDGSITGLERCDLLCASANSLRRASSSRSNLRFVREFQYNVLTTNTLSAEDFDVESSSVPHAHTKYKQEVCTRPERRVIENNDRGDVCKNGVDLNIDALLVRPNEMALVTLTKLPQHKV